MGDSQTHRQYGDLISLLLFYFFQNKEIWLKRRRKWNLHPSISGRLQNGKCHILYVQIKRYSGNVF
jgi:hypothetical protein